MKPYLSDPDFTLYCGDVCEVLAGLEPESVHCVVTSPPYWGLRDYGTAAWDGGDPDCEHLQKVGGTAASTLGAASGGNDMSDAARARSTSRSFVPYVDVCGKCGAVRVDKQIGLEQSPVLYVERMVAVFREVRRVLRPDGTCWLNIGDSYSQGKKGNSGAIRPGDKQGTSKGSLDTRRGAALGPNRTGGADVKVKDLVGIPWRLAFALQDDGWFLRSDVIWAKPNPMPESVSDRPAKSHEYLFLLAKNARYFYDGDAIKEPSVGADRGPGMTRGVNGPHVQLGDRPRRTAAIAPARQAPLIPEQTKEGIGRQGVDSETFGHWPKDGTRNRRTVWTIPTESYADAHFATFPQALVEPCVKAGTSERGVCPQCGAPWERIVERAPERGSYHDHSADLAGGMSQEKPNNLAGGDFYREYVEPKTVGWQETCDCAGLDLRVIVTPTGEGVEPDPTMLTGRAGMNRVRNVGSEGRLMTRHEQAAYAIQLRASPARPELEAMVGRQAFAHYIRTDEAGARPVPPWLLEAWITEGYLERVTIPEHVALSPVPATVLDPFMGSGTTALVARRLGRRSIGVELNTEYCELAGRRLAQLTLFTPCDTVHLSPEEK